MSIAQILGAMRSVLRKRAEADGAVALSLTSQLARNFRICDRNHNGVLDVDEFSRCVAICRLGLHEKAVRRLHAAFDSDGSGSINYDEFLAALDPDSASVAALKPPTSARGMAMALGTATVSGVEAAAKGVAAAVSQLPAITTPIAAELAAAAPMLAAAGISFDATIDAASRATPPRAVPVPTAAAAAVASAIAPEPPLPTGTSRAEQASLAWPMRPIVPRLHNLRERLRAADDAPQPEPYMYPQPHTDDEESEMDSARSSVMSSARSAPGL